MKNRVAVIDLDPLVHIVCNAQYSAGNRTNFKALKVQARAFINTVLTTADSTHYVMFVQGLNHDNYRKKALESYKGHRKPSDALDAFKRPLINYLATIEGVNVLTSIESDDASSIYAKAIKEYIIIENDKDMWSIPGIHYNPYKKKLTQQTQWYSVSPDLAELVKWSQILSGDGTDAGLDVTGVKGLAAGKPDSANIWKPGKAMNMLLPLQPAMYRARVAEEYMKVYGISEGLRRMAITYDVIHILEDPEDALEESRTILNIKPTPYTKTVEGLFND